MLVTRSLPPATHGAWRSPQDRLGLGIRCPRAGFAAGVFPLAYYTKYWLRVEIWNL